MGLHYFAIQKTKLHGPLRVPCFHDCRDVLTRAESGAYVYNSLNSLNGVYIGYYYRGYQGGY